MCLPMAIAGLLVYRHQLLKHCCNFLEPDVHGVNIVFLQAEIAMREAGKPGMTDEEVCIYYEHFKPVSISQFGNRL